MADLMRSLIPPPTSSQPQSKSLHHASSDESFHSTESQPAQPPSASAQHHGLPIYDIDSYLAEESHAASLSATNTEPVPLGSKTSHHVATLNTLCQAKALPTPIFEIEQEGATNDPRFFGIVKVGEITVGSNLRWRNKKEAKEGLSSAALATVQETTARGGREAGSSSNKNWVGLLQDYHNYTYKNTQSPIYNYYSLGTTFSATCTLPSHPDRTFGSSSTCFPSKKTAQAAAAAEAISLLISEDKLNQDGTTPSARKKKASSGSADSSSSTTTAITFNADNSLSFSPHSSYAQRVSDIAPLLGLSQPQYQLSASSSSTPNILSGFAIFASSGGVDALKGEVGEARNVFGKKNAKEEVARAVWEVLVAVAEGRGVRVREK